MRKNTVFWTISILFLMASCTCQQKVNRLHKQCPQVFEAYTITVNDTVILPAIVNYDTIFSLQQGDTVFIDTGKVHIQLIKLNDTIYKANVNVEPDTVYFSKEIYIDKIKEVEIYKKGFFYYMGILFFVVLLTIIVHLCVKLTLKR